MDRFETINNRLTHVFFRSSAILLDLFIAFFICLCSLFIFHSKVIADLPFLGSAMIFLTHPFLAALFAILFFLQRDIHFSPGKSLFNIQVKNSFGKKPVNFKQGLIRSIILLIPGLIVIEFFMILFRQDKKRIGDIITETHVCSDNAVLKNALIFDLLFLLFSCIMVYIYYSKVFVFTLPGQLLK